ncbi:RE2 [Symbiodinium natans]|uniref:RE2 protein n=1 Tax=Symbiodinium natans TaxID=878477 RepID=A0A812VG00_9DINO|nr:RE2 [Symbiodinium natans]
MERRVKGFESSSSEGREERKRVRQNRKEKPVEEESMEVVGSKTHFTVFPTKKKPRTEVVLVPAASSTQAMEVDEGKTEEQMSVRLTPAAENPSRSSKAEAVRVRRLLKYRGGASAASASSGPKTKAMPKKKTVIRTKAMPKNKTTVRTKAMPKPPTHHTQTVQTEIPLSREEVRSLPILTLRDHLDHHHYAVMIANLMKPMAVDQKEFRIENSAVMITKDRVTVTRRSTTGKSVTFTSTASTSNTSPGKQRHDDSSDASSGAGDTTFFCVFLERGNEQVTESQRSKQKHVRAELGLAGVERELVVGVEGEGERVERGSLGEVEREALGEVGAWWLAGDSEVLSELDWKNARNEHVLRSHVPYNSSCEECRRARSLQPARKRDPAEAPRREVQADKMFWFRSVGMFGSEPVVISLRSDGEPALISFLQDCAKELPAASIEKVPVDRHAPSAERGIRTVRELANVQLVQLEKAGLSVCGPAMPYLLSHVATAHNRYSLEDGSGLTPEQTFRQKAITPHPMYVFGATVLAVPPPSLRNRVTGRMVKGAYLGPEVGSGSHWVRIQTNDGQLRVMRSPKFHMVVPMRFEMVLVKGVLKILPGRPRPPQEEALPVDQLKHLPLPDTNLRGPTPEWIEKCGPTPKCRACRARLPKGVIESTLRHTERCRARYAKFVREQFDSGTYVLTDEAAQHDDGAGVGDIEFGEDVEREVERDTVEHGDLVERALAGEDVPELELPGDVSGGGLSEAEPDYEPGEAAEDTEERPLEDYVVAEEDLMAPLEHAPEDAMMEIASRVGEREAVFAATSPGGEEVVTLGGGQVRVSKPSGSRDDVTEAISILGWQLENAKPQPTPPSLRDLFDKAIDDPTEQAPLSPEAASRYRRALGKLAWLATTRADMPYWVSMLSRGQASPLQVHEKAMRATLRYLKTDELRLCAFVDASWGSERSVSRRSISGGCVMLGRACIKSWSRLQQAVALSSAESELYALVEGSKEALGVRCAIGHILDNLVSLKPQIFCDSEAAVNISKMDGLRKLRHMELRSCFVQSEVQMGNILVV